jgi:hypothetical protein
MIDAESTPPRAGHRPHHTVGAVICTGRLSDSRPVAQVVVTVTQGFGDEGAGLGEGGVDATVVEQTAAGSFLGQGPESLASFDVRGV